MLKRLVFLLSTIILIIITPVCLANNDLFTDLNSSHPNFNAIKYLQEHYIIHGYPDGSFKPDQEINRAEALKIILLSANYHFTDESLTEINSEITKIIDSQTIISATPDNTVQPVISYTDVQKEQWFYPYVMKASLIGIVQGYDDHTFKPENTVNLAEALKMIMATNEINNTEKIAGDPYKDVSSQDWFAPYVQYFKNYHLLYSNDGYLYPNSPITRAKLSELIYRFVKRDEFKLKTTENGQEYIYGKATFYGEGDGFDGQGTASGDIFDKNKPTAAHLSLPFGTKIRVYSLENGTENGKYVDVAITDRGPYDKRFILDLSSSSFEQLAPISRGFIDVKYEILKKP